jgi:hypothetical protein
MEFSLVLVLVDLLYGLAVRVPDYRKEMYYDTC